MYLSRIKFDYTYFNFIINSDTFKGICLVPSSSTGKFSESSFVALASAAESSTVGETSSSCVGAPSWG